MGNLTWFVAAQHAPLNSQLGGLGIFVLSACAWLVAAHQIRDERWLRWLTWTFLGAGGLYMLLRMAPGAIGNQAERLFVRGAINGSMFWTWLVALSLGQALFNRSLGRGGRVLVGSVGLLTLAVGLGEGRSWDSGWMPPVVALGVLFVLRSWRTSLVLAALAALAYFPLQPLLERVLVTSNAYSIMTRLAAWEILGEIIKVNPVLGLGPANYYWYTPLYSILGWYVNFNSHNQYIDLVAQVGILGTVCYLWFMAAMLVYGWTLRRERRGDFADGYIHGCLAGVAATLFAGLLGDWVLPFVYNIGLSGFRASVLAWVFMGGLIALGAMLRTTTSATSATNAMASLAIGDETA
jgi:O-antigen ligase